MRDLRGVSRGSWREGQAPERGCSPPQITKLRGEGRRGHHSTCMKCPEQVNRQRVSGYQELRDDEGVITKGHRISLGEGVVTNGLSQTAVTTVRELGDYTKRQCRVH